MGLFGFGKKKEETTTAACGCACGGSCCGESAPQTGKIAPQGGEGSILILGSGCKNCQTLEANTRTALERMGDAHWAVGHVTDFAEIAKYGVMSTPGLVVDGKVVSAGKVLKAEEIEGLLKKVQG